jgi:flagellar biosynthesis chaperone FliJ
MTQARTRRARKLLAVEASRVAERERELAMARRELEACEVASRSAADEARAADDAWLEVSSAEDLARASARRRTLETRLVQRGLEVSRAAAAVRACEERLVAARIAERRFEILIEGFERVELARERKVERKAADEHAARKSGVAS